MENNARHRPAHGSSPEPRAGVSGAAAWVRGHLVLAGLLSVVIVGLVAVTVIFIGGSGTTTSSSKVVGSKAAGAQAANTVTKGSDWLGGSEARNLTTVNADLGRVMAEELKGSRSGAAKAAGARLAADATAGVHGPMPPVDAAGYRLAMQRLAAAGSAAAAGKFSPRAAQLLHAGQAGLMRVTEAADAPVKAKTPAIPEPNGQ
jgi:hypothetical protein